METNHGLQLGLITIANGYKLEFQRFPPFSGIRERVVNANNQAILNVEIESLLQTAVIEPVPFAQRLQGFYSTFFLAPKKMGDLQAVINLRPLNQYLKTQHFKMDALKTSQEKRLGNINRLERCLFPRVYSTKAQEISSFFAFRAEHFSSEHWLF